MIDNILKLDYSNTINLNNRYFIDLNDNINSKNNSNLLYSEKYENDCINNDGESELLKVCNIIDYKLSKFYPLNEVTNPPIRLRDVIVKCFRFNDILEDILEEKCFRTINETIIYKTINHEIHTL